MSALDFIRRTTLVALTLIAGSTAHAADEGFDLYPGGAYREGIPTPAHYLGYALGQRYTPHHRVIDYVETVADVAADRVRQERYGRTPEGRDLLLITVTSPRNLERLADIRSALDKLADPRLLESAEESETLLESTPTVVWLSFNVHGNETSSTEAALATLYQLAAGEDEGTLQMLEETIVLIDPNLNPDGRERYVSWLQSIAAPGGNPDPNAVEHDEPWPGGRTNHFYFDLNRDWAWMTQDETRARIPHFLAWHPQVHVDFHEMSHESSYFFFPADAPINQNFPPMVIEWGERFGAGNAAAFDEFGWPYYTAESFDLYYPGYGDSYPSLHGAIGMTYEQAGHSSAGLVVEREDGSLLSLRDRLHHHFIAAMATVQTAATGRRELLGDYAEFRRRSIDEGRWGRIREFLLEPGADPVNTAELVGLLLDHGVEVERAQSEFELEGVHAYVKNGPAEKRRFPAGTYLIPLAQPQRTLAKALLEPHSAISKLTFYDISAWSLPLAYGVPASWSEQRAEVARERITTKPIVTGGVDGAPAKFAYLLPWSNLNGARALATLLERGLRAGCARESFELRGRKYPRGTIVVPVGQDPSVHRIVAEVAAESGARFESAPTALTERGIDLGSEQIQRLERPAIAVATGPGVDANSYGAIRFLLERVSRFPFTSVSLERLPRLDLTRYNVLVLPNGWGYSGEIDGLQRWIREGGVVIALGGAASFVSKEGSGLTSVSTRLEPAEESKSEEPTGWVKIDERRQRRRSQSTPGAIVTVELDPAHPLAFGYESKSLHALVSSRRSFGLDVGTPVAVFPSSASVAGFLPEAREADLAGRAYLVDVPMGRGHVVLFAEDPNFRLFWNGLTRLFLNSLLLLDKEPVFRSR